MEKKNHTGRGKSVPPKNADTLKYPAYVCHVWSIRTGTVFGISPAIVLLMNGVGTLLFLSQRKGACLPGIQFCLPSPALLVISKYGYEYALGRGFW